VPRVRDWAARAGPACAVRRTGRSGTRFRRPGPTLALVLRPLFGVGNPRGRAEHAQATFLALSASVRALLHCWHAFIRSRIGFSRGVDLFHAPEPHILLRWLSLDLPHQSEAASGSRPDERAPSRAGWWLRARAGFSARARRSAQGAFPPRACLLCPRLRRCPRHGAPPSCDSRWNAKESAGEAPRLRVAHAPSPSFHGSRGISAGVLCTRGRAAFQCLATLPAAQRTPLPRRKCNAHSIPLFGWPGAVSAQLKRVVGGGRRRKLSGWPGGKRPKYRRGLRLLG
jgi:hypothetical protein